MNEFDFIESTLTTRKENTEINKSDNYMENVLNSKKENSNPTKTIVNGKVSNINQPRFKQEIEKRGKFKIKGSWQTKIIAGTLAVAIIIGVGVILIKKFTKPYTLPDNYKEVIYTENVGRDDTFYSVIDDYYKDSKEYEGLYKNEKGYQKEVLELNDLSKPDTVNYYGELDVPVILDVNSEAYKLYQEINNLKQEKQSKYFFVKYTVKQGDTISHLASLSAFDNNELINYTKIIQQKNGSNILIPGTEIDILNPELYEVSERLNNAIQEFESLVKNESKTM